jgi:hypothetical protein
LSTKRAFVVAILPGRITCESHGAPFG